MPSVGETFRVSATITTIGGAVLVPTSQSVKLYYGSTLKYEDTTPTPLGSGWYVDFTTLTTDPSGLWLVVWTASDGTVTCIGKLKIYIDDPPV